MKPGYRELRVKQLAAILAKFAPAKQAHRAPRVAGSARFAKRSESPSR